MKLKELEVKMQERLDRIDWSKIKNHNDFHATVENVLTVIMVTGNGLRVGTWDIYHKDYDNKVFRYTRDFIEDKRCRWEDRGTFKNVKVELIIDNIEADHKNLLNYFQKKQNLEALNSWKGEVADLEKRLSEAKIRLENITEQCNKDSELVVV